MKADRRRAGRSTRRARQRQARMRAGFRRLSIQFDGLADAMAGVGDAARVAIGSLVTAYARMSAHAHLYTPVAELDGVPGDGDLIAMTRREKEKTS